MLGARTIHSQAIVYAERVRSKSSSGNVREEPVQNADLAAMTIAQRTKADVMFNLRTVDEKQNQVKGLIIDEISNMGPIFLSWLNEIILKKSSSDIFLEV
jgi:hypothetical protein